MIDTQPVDGTTSSENTAAAISMETNPQQFQVNSYIHTHNNCWPLYIISKLLVLVMSQRYEIV